MILVKDRSRTLLPGNGCPRYGAFRFTFQLRPLIGQKVRAQTSDWPACCFLLPQPELDYPLGHDYWLLRLGECEWLAVQWVAAKNARLTAVTRAERGQLPAYYWPVVNSPASDWSLPTSDVCSNADELIKIEKLIKLLILFISFSFNTFDLK